MLSRKPRRPNPPIRLWVLGILCLASLAAADKSTPDEESLLTLILTSLSLHGPILIGTAIFLRGYGMRWREAFGFFTPPVGRAIFLGFIVALMFLPVTFVLQDVSIKILTRSHFETPPQAAVQEFSKAVSLPSRAYLAFFAIVIAPFAEEVFFRGIIYGVIKKMGHPHIALWISALVFAAIHVSAPIFLPLLVLGLVLAWLYERTNNLLASITAHGVFNAVNVVLLFFGDQLKDFFDRHVHHFS